jgi:endonuclease VIII
MPEGPSIVILKEAVQGFNNQKIVRASGNTKKLDTQLMNGKKILDFKSWGKHFLICFSDFSIRIHFMLFGSYRINERKPTEPRLSLQFKNGELNFYACSVQLIEAPLSEVYDWTADVMNENWDSEKAKLKLGQKPDTLVCDALLDQNIFAGVGNIIKNEVLFRIGVHPESRLGAMPQQKIDELVAEAVNYSFDFLKWKKEFTLKKHWLAHTKKICPRDGVPFIKKHLGKTNRRSFYCTVCQLVYK